MRLFVFMVNGDVMIVRAESVERALAAIETDETCERKPEGDERSPYELTLDGPEEVVW